MKRIAFQSRDNRGAAMICLCLALFIFLGMLGLFAYDMNRIQMAQRQLTALCDAAAMAGSAMLASQDVSYEDSKEDQLYTAQETAVQYAVNMFCMGAILGTRLYDPLAGSAPSPTSIPVSYSTVTTGGQTYATSASGSAPTTASANSIQLWVILTDPSTSYTNYQTGNAQGRAFVIQAVYGYQPTLGQYALGGWTGIGSSVSVVATSTAATQLMNVVLVFDCSGSMDDNTSVTFVERTWGLTQNPTVGQSGSGFDGYSYAPVANSGADNRLFNYVGLNYGVAPNGTPLNVLPPQNLTDLGYLYNPGGLNPFTGTTGYYAWGDSLTAGFYGANPPLAMDISMRSYVPVPQLWGTSYPVPNAGLPLSGSFPGPWYDNDFGTPPGNCPYKYGTQQSLATWSGVGGKTGWDANANHGWGPSTSSGWYNAPPPALIPGGTGDGNTYFYDPNSMPVPYTGNSYAPFTDMVVNLVNLSFPVSQPTPADGASSLSSAYSGFSYTFPSTTFTVFFAEGNSGSSAYDYEADSQLRGVAFKFTNLAYLVEASRGNLDLDNNGNATNYVNAMLAGPPTASKAVDKQGDTMPIISDCKHGYQKAYQRLAMYVSQPFATAQAGAFKFFQNLAQTSAAYFGFVGFSASPETYTGNPDTCGYLTNGGFPCSLFYSCTGTPSGNNPTYAGFFYQVPFTGPINPNVWMWAPTIVTSPGSNPPGVGPSGPAASPTGIPYSATYNSTGPSATTWMDLSFGGSSYGSGSVTAAKIGSPAGGTNTSTLSWAFTNVGFQIPRCFLSGANSDLSTGQTQLESFNGCCSPTSISIWNPNAATSQDWGTTNTNAGTNGLFHCRPLTDTAALEAIEAALADLGVSVSGGSGTSAYTFKSLTSYSTSLTNARPGAINVIVFFTDGTPTDAVIGTNGSVSFSDYTSQVISPAQQNGIPIYSIGLALNSNVQAEQYTFLNTLANNGANGSQFFQVTDASTLTAAFTSISKQLTQCVR